MKIFCVLCDHWSQYCKCEASLQKQYPENCKCPPLDWNKLLPVPDICSNYESVTGESGPCKCGHDKICHYKKRS